MRDLKCSAGAGMTHCRDRWGVLFYAFSLVIIFSSLLCLLSPVVEQREGIGNTLHPSVHVVNWNLKNKLVTNFHFGVWLHLSVKKFKNWVLTSKYKMATTIFIYI